MQIQHHETYSSAQVKRIHHWIERLESKAIELLDGLEIEEMTPKHQADVAFKCLDHVQRLTLIEQKLQDATQAHDNQDLLAKFMRAARGELELSEILDAQPTSSHLMTAGAGLAPAREHTMTEEEKRRREIDEEYDRFIHDDEFWEWLDEQVLQWEEHTYTEYEARAESDSWLNNGWYLDQGELPWDEGEFPWDEGELPWDEC
jgi:hypothetical protein